MSSPCVTVNCAALQNNYKRIQSLFPHSKVMVVIKANAYGHGMYETANALSLADAFAVSDIAELKYLRERDINNDIIVLCGVSNIEDMEYCFHHNAHVVIHSNHQIELLRRLNIPSHANVIIKINTGMNRLGFSADCMTDISKQLQGISENISMRYMTHMACADDLDNPLTQLQQDSLQSVIENGQCWGVANSATLLNYSDMFSSINAAWIRPGLIVYGVLPSTSMPSNHVDLQPVMSFQADLIAINKVAKGSYIGYGADYRCEQDMLVGIVNAGYSDGYPQTASSKTLVYVNDTYTHLVGRVSMNMLAISLQGVTNPQIGDMVELWGEHIAVTQVAENSGRIPYELLCAASHIKHTYI